MTLTDIFVSPFTDYLFMRRALVASIAIALGGAPLGVVLVLRRMTLVGDAISHALLPGVAVAYLFFGFSMQAFALGGTAAGLCIALIAGGLTRVSQIKEDASFTGIYLISLAAGVLIISLHGSSVDLMHVLFGNVLAISADALQYVCLITSFSLLMLAVLYRRIVAQCFDAGFLQALGVRTAMTDLAFLGLLVLNLVSALQALGALMALSVMVLPAIASRFWCQRMDGSMCFSVLASIISSYAGLLLSYHANLPSGPSIVLFAGSIYLFSVICGSHGSVLSRLRSRSHFAS